MFQTRSFVVLILVLAAAATWAQAPKEQIKPAADPVRKAKLFLETLRAGQAILGDRLFKSPGMVGSYYEIAFQEVAADIAKLSKAPQPDGLSQVEAKLDRLEHDLIIESVNILPSTSLGARRAYTAWAPNGDKGLADAKKRNQDLEKEIKEQIADWQRNTEGLKRNDINLDLSIEMERIGLGCAQALQTAIPDRLFEQRYGFYSAIVFERQRVAAGALEIEQALSAWQNTIALRKQLGAKLDDAKSLMEIATKAAANYRQSVNRESYASQLIQAKTAREAFEKLKTSVTALDGQVPILWPGASLYSTGRFAMGGSWAGLLNCEIDQLGLYRDKTEFKLSQDDKMQWAFSFTPPGVSRFETELLEQSWTHSTRRFHFPAKGQATKGTQDVTWSILAPGTLVNTPGPVMQLSNTTLGNPLPPQRVLAMIKGKPTLFGPQDRIESLDMTENWLLLLTENNLPVFPVMVVFEHRPESLVWTKEGIEVKRITGVGRCVIALPYGALPLEANFSKAWAQVPQEVLKQVHQVLPLLTYYPLTTEEYFSVGQDSVRIWSKVTKSVQLKSSFCTPGKPYIPLAPLYAMSLPLNMGLKVNSPLSDELMMTKYGPYRVTNDTVLSYRVPKARMWDRMELRPLGEDQAHVDRLNQMFPKIAWECSRFTEIGTFMPGYLMLNAENREKARFYKNPLELEAGIANEQPLRMAWAYSGWANSDPSINIDPTTGQSYQVVGWRGSRHNVRMRGDVPNFASMWLNGVYCYARYFDAWDMVERHWPAVHLAYSAVPARQDWAVPGHDCLSTGFILSGDMAGDGWRANQMMANLAGILGHTEDQFLAEYIGSYTLLTLATLGHPATLPYRHRLVNMPITKCKNLDDVYVNPRAIDTGLAAGIAKDGYQQGAWQPLYTFSGCVVFSYPMFDGLFTLYPEVGNYQIQNFPKFFPTWLDESYLNYPTNPLNLVNIAGSTNYMGYLAWSGANKSTTAGYWDRFIHTLEEGKMYRFAGYSGITAFYPYFIAQGNPLWLASWDTAKLEDGIYDRKQCMATIHIAASRAGKLQLACATPIAEIRINGQRLSDQDFSYHADTQELAISYPQGKQKVTIQLQPVNSTALQPGFLKYTRTAQPTTVPGSSPDPGSFQLQLLTGDLKVGNTIPVDISAVVNRGFLDHAAQGGVPGTHDDGESWEFPKGTVVLRGVPFTFIDPAANHNKTCLVLKGMAKPSFPAEASNIRVGKRIKRIFFLQGVAYTGNDADVVLTYVLKFKGGERRELNMRNRTQIGEWKIPPNGYANKSTPLDRLSDLPDARGSMVWPPTGGHTAWGLGSGGYVYAWENDVKEAGISQEGGVQRGLDTLESIDIFSAGKAVPMVFAITAELAE